MSFTQIKVDNSEQLIKLLNSMPDVIRSKATLEGLKAGANLINEQARTRLMASKKGENVGSYYMSAFKIEQLTNRPPEEMGVKTGVWDKKNGYKLRWLEWGTVDRYTRKRKNAKTGKITGNKFRGSMQGNHFFFGTVRTQEDAVFQAISKAVIRSLDELTSKSQ